MMKVIRSKIGRNVVAKNVKMSLSIIWYKAKMSFFKSCLAKIFEAVKNFSKHKIKQK